MDEPKVPEEKIEETPEEVPVPKAEGEEDKKTRTQEQFEKLTQSNKELKEERDQYKNLFEGLRPEEVPQEAQQYQQPINQAPPATEFQNINQTDVNEKFKEMIDENGYLDGNKLMETLRAMDDRAQRAEIAARQVQEANLKKEAIEREREEKDATLKVYERFPQLDPNNIDGVEKDGETVSFDPKMWQYVKNELESKARRGVMPSNTDYMAAAEQVYQDLYGGRDMAKKDEQKKVVEQKNIINATRPRSTTNVNYYKDEEESVLIDQVRAGKRGAVGELLRRRGL